VTAESLAARLREFPGQVHVAVEDNGGDKWHVVIVSNHFKGMPLLAQQRSVFKHLEAEMKGIHALTQKLYTVEKWEQQQQKAATAAAAGGESA
jgi:stress-induced morphogen